MSRFKEDLTSMLNTSLSKGEDQNSADSEVSLKQEDLTDTSKPRLSKEKDMRSTESKTNEREDWATNALSLIKEDLSVFKEDLSLYKEDLAKALKLSLSKENNVKITGSGMSSLRERDEKKVPSALNLFKQDFNVFKEDFNSVFKIGLSKEKDEKASAPKTSSSKEAFTNVFKIKVGSNRRGERTASPRMRLSQPLKMRQTKDVWSTEITERPTSSGTEKTVQRAAPSVMGLSKEDWTDMLKLGSSKDKERKTADSMSEREDCTGSGDCSVVLREDLKMEKREEEVTQSFGSLLWETSISKSLSEKDCHDEVMNSRPGGEFWTMKNYACYLTLDPNTANQELHLSDDNRNVTRTWTEQPYPDHQERFGSCPQVLCREGLLESFYWEVEWDGGADVGVTYSSISRDGDVDSCLLGHNDKSWSLECSEGSYTPCYNNKRSKSSSPSPFSRRVGVYLDWAGGTLSFYSVSPDTMTHLHTFHTTFTEPLYPGFWVWSLDGSVSLCQVQLEWERLLQ